MDYGELVSGTWRLTWRNRGLWWVGLFAGSASGSCSGTNFNSGGQDFDSLDEAFGNQPGFDAGLAAVQAGLAEAAPILIVVGIILGIIFLLFWLLAVACTAAVIVGGRDAAAGQQVTVGVAWSRGMPAFGRLFLLELLWLIFWLVVVGVILVIAISSLANQARTGGDMLRAVFNLFGVLAIVGILGSVLSIVLAYAQRAVVLDGAGAVDSIGAAFGLFRQKLGASLLVWLIGLALAIGGGIGLVIGAVILALPTLLVAAILGFLANLGGVNGFGVGAVVLGLVLAVALIVGGAALNTYMWHYWTLAYLRLTGALAPVTPPAPQPVPEAA
jgi:hypothetical protein